MAKNKSSNGVSCPLNSSNGSPRLDYLALKQLATSERRKRPRTISCFASSLDYGPSTATLSYSYQLTNDSCSGYKAHDQSPQNLPNRSNRRENVSHGSNVQFWRMAFLLELFSSRLFAPWSSSQSSSKSSNGSRWSNILLLITLFCAIMATACLRAVYLLNESYRATNSSKWALNSITQHQVSRNEVINPSYSLHNEHESSFDVAETGSSHSMMNTSPQHKHDLSTLRLEKITGLISPEALQAVNTANTLLQSRNVNNYKKAKRLLKHAVKLSPKSPHAWLQLGNYLEFYEQNLIEAETMYKRAYICDPHSSEAVALIKRSEPSLQEIYSSIYHRIDKKRDLIAQVPTNDPALKRAKRESYYLHIHHTNAIEGNSMSLLQTRSIIETGYVIPGKTIKEHTEVLGLHDALSYINSTLVNKPGGGITVKDLLEIHRRVLAYTEPHVAGMFRNHQVYIANHIPPPPDLIEHEIDNFLTWLNSPSASKLHPIELAALAHYWLVHIHPFVDGNGRTGRLLMNLILMQSGFPPVTIKFTDRSAYYEFLQLGNEGDIRPFLRFIASCTERTLDSYLEQVMVGRGSSGATNGQHRHKSKHIDSTNSDHQTIPITDIPSLTDDKSKKIFESVFENSIRVSYEIDQQPGDESSPPSESSENVVIIGPVPKNADDDTIQQIRKFSKLECPFDGEFCSVS